MGKQVVCPPSIHPDTGVDYKWLAPINGSIAELPEHTYGLLNSQPVTPLLNASDSIVARAVDEEALPISARIKELIQFGDTTNQYNGDRSAALYACMVAMATHGVHDDVICAVLSDPGNRISECVYAESRRKTRDSAIEWVRRQIPKAKNEKLQPRINVGPTQDIWPEPTPLPYGLPPVMPLDPGMIPYTLRPWIIDIAERMEIPPDFSAAAAIVAAGSVIGRQVGIHPKARDDWMVIPNLWGAGVGRPSLLKSPAIDQATKPLNRLIADAEKQFNDAKVGNAVDHEVVDARISAAKSKLKAALKGTGTKKIADLEEAKVQREAIIKEAEQYLQEAMSAVTEEARLRRYITQDPTIEAIGQLLTKNPNSLLLLRDELTGWFASLDKAGHEAARAFYLESWSGDKSYTIDRIMRGTVYIEALCISIFGSIQPGPLSTYVYQAQKQGTGDDGLIQRFQMLVYPDPPTKWTGIDRWPNNTAKNVAFDVFKALDNLNIGVTDQFGNISTLRFDQPGQEVFNEWLHSLQNRLYNETFHPAFESHLAKYRSLMPSLALIFQLVDAPQSQSVGSVAASQAASWCTYLETHANRVYGAAQDPGMESAKELLKHIKGGDVEDGFTPRQIVKKHWSKLGSKEEVDNAVDSLETHYWIQAVMSPSTGGRPSKRIILHPSLRSQNNNFF